METVGKPLCKTKPGSAPAAEEVVVPPEAQRGPGGCTADCGRRV